MMYIWIAEGFNTIVNEIYKEYGYEDRLIGNQNLVEYPYSGTSDQEGIPPIVIIIGLILIVPLIILDFKLTGGVFTYMFIRAASRGGGSSRSGPRNSGRGGSGGGGGSSRRF